MNKIIHHQQVETPIILIIHKCFSFQVHTFQFKCEQSDNKFVSDTNLSNQNSSYTWSADEDSSTIDDDDNDATEVVECDGKVLWKKVGAGEVGWDTTKEREAEPAMPLNDIEVSDEDKNNYDMK